MALTIADVYSIRFGAKLSLPKIVQDNVARLRITPAPYKPVKLFTTRGTYRNHMRPNNAVETENWRKSALIDMVRRVRERDDPEYSEIFSIFNKISPGNIEKLSADAVGYIQKRDETFRLRVTTLLFDKAITQPSFSGVMSECARLLNIAIPEIGDDLQTQISMFPNLYNMSETITFPDSTQPGFNDKVVTWMSQKEKRRGYAKFMMELHSKDLICEDIVKQSLDQVIAELNDIVREQSTEKTLENVGQFVEFIFETSKNIKGSLKRGLCESVEALLAIPRKDLPSLNMRSRFKLEDAFKQLNNKA